MTTVDPARALVDAMSRLVPEPMPATHLATVVSSNASGCLVLFDGESVASPRRYKATAAAVAGQRVVMLRVGSTWVVSGRIDDAARDTDNLALFHTNGYTGVSKLARRGNVVDVYLDATAPAGGIVANGEIVLIPVEHRPLMPNLRYTHGIDGGTGAQVPIYYSPSGFIHHLFARSAGQRIAGVLTWLAVD